MSHNRHKRDTFYPDQVNDPPILAQMLKPLDTKMIKKVKQHTSSDTPNAAMKITPDYVFVQDEILQINSDYIDVIRPIDFNNTKLTIKNIKRISTEHRKICSKLTPRHAPSMYRRYPKLRTHHEMKLFCKDRDMQLPEIRNHYQSYELNKFIESISHDYETSPHNHVFAGLHLHPHSHEPVFNSDNSHYNDCPIKIKIPYPPRKIHETFWNWKNNKPRNIGKYPLTYIRWKGQFEIWTFDGTHNETDIPNINPKLPTICQRIPDAAIDAPYEFCRIRQLDIDKTLEKYIESLDALVRITTSHNADSPTATFPWNRETLLQLMPLAPLDPIPALRNKKHPAQPPKDDIISTEAEKLLITGSAVLLGVFTALASTLMGLILHANMNTKSNNPPITLPELTMTLHTAKEQNEQLPQLMKNYTTKVSLRETLQDREFILYQAFMRQSLSLTTAIDMFHDTLTSAAYNIVSTDILSQHDLDFVRRESTKYTSLHLNTNPTTLEVRPTIHNDKLALRISIPLVDPSKTAILYSIKHLPTFTTTGDKYIPNCPEGKIAILENGVNYVIPTAFEYKRCITSPMNCLIGSPISGNSNNHCLARAFFKTNPAPERTKAPDNNPFLHTYNTTTIFSVPPETTIDLHCDKIPTAGPDNHNVISGKGNFENSLGCRIELHDYDIIYQPANIISTHTYKPISTANVEFQQYIEPPFRPTEEFQLLDTIWSYAHGLVPQAKTHTTQETLIILLACCIIIIIFSTYIKPCLIKATRRQRPRREGITINVNSSSSQHDREHGNTPIVRPHANKHDKPPVTPQQQQPSAPTMQNFNKPEPKIQHDNLQRNLQDTDDEEPPQWQNDIYPPLPELHWSIDHIPTAEEIISTRTHEDLTSQILKIHRLFVLTLESVPTNEQQATTRKLASIGLYDVIADLLDLHSTTTNYYITEIQNELRELNYDFLRMPGQPEDDARTEQIRHRMNEIQDLRTTAKQITDISDHPTNAIYAEMVRNDPPREPQPALARRTPFAPLPRR